MSLVRRALGPRFALAAVALLLLAVGPLRAGHAAASAAARGLGALRAPGPPPDSLRAAIANCTSDYGELAYLVQEFLRQPGADPAVEARFRAFLAGRARQAHPRLEAALDWALAAYKFAAPFIVISLLARLTRGEGGEADAAPGAPLPCSPGGDARWLSAACEPAWPAPAKRAVACADLSDEPGLGPGTPVELHARGF
jgi:hypothetical protein